MKLRRLLCWLIGHEPDYGHAINFDEYACGRCCLIDPPDSWPARAFARIRHRWHWRVGVWMERCPDCGLRFKKHDLAVEHLPF